MASRFIQKGRDLASSPGSLIFSTHTRKEGEPGIHCHVRDIDPYIRVGRVVKIENY